MIGILRGQNRVQVPGGAAIHELRAHGDFADPAAALSQVRGAREQLSRCGAARSHDDFMALLDIAPDGRVADHWVAPTPQTSRKRDACLVKALSALRFAPIEKGTRRIAITLSLEPAVSHTARDYLFGPLDLESGVRVSVASDDSAQVSPLPLSDFEVVAELAGCLPQHAPDAQGTLELDVTLGVRPDGHAQPARVAAREGSEVALDAGLSRCLSRALQTARFDCTRDGKPAELQARVCLRRDDVTPTPPGEPQAQP